MRGYKHKHTLELLQDSLHGTGAAATAHGDVELVLMVRHRVRACLDSLLRRRGCNIAAGLGVFAYDYAKGCVSR